MATTFGICTLGCKVNYYESTAIAQLLTEQGLLERDFDRYCDIYIINTCAVTAESERKAGQMVRRARSKNSTSYIIVTGCMSQLFPEKSAFDDADFICGNREKLLAAKAALDYARGNATRAQVIIRQSLEGAPFEKMSIKKSDRTRAYLKIGDGCESSCAYCIIKKARGPIRSKPLCEVISEARALVENGYREIVLTAIEISAYGKDLEGTDLADLINEMERIDGLERIRLGSVDPAMLKKPFIDRIAGCKKLCPHFHLSIQSGCDRTLNRMRRKYNTEMISEGVRLLRQAFEDVCFSCDVIVGFPGETKEEFEQSARFVSELGLLHAHVFAFSPRKGTEACDMPDQVSKQEKSERSAFMSSLCDKGRDSLLEGYAGRVMPVLFEEMRDGVCYGHTPNFIEVALPCARDLRGSTLSLRLEENRNGIMYASLPEELS